MVYFDSHCHLNDDKAFPDPDQAVREAREAGVRRLAVIGIDLETSALALEIAGRNEGIVGTVGIHPTETKEFSQETLSALRKLAQSPECAAIGEIGLDYHWDFSPKSRQIEALAAQLELANELEKPVVFHCRNAYEDLLGFIRDHRPASFVCHCFSGTPEQAYEAIELGGMLGFDGPITFPKNLATRELLAELPRDRILLETDSPYLAPVPYRGKANHPKYLPFVSETLAECWGTSPEEAACVTFENASRFYCLPVESEEPPDLG